jgi:short chain dehydrogenase
MNHLMTRQKTMKASELFDVNGRIVTITGAASGIGLACAEVMASNGAIVNLIDIDAQALAASVERIRLEGGEVHGEVADLTPSRNIARGVCQCEHQRRPGLSQRRRRTQPGWCDREPFARCLGTRHGHLYRSIAELLWSLPHWP